MTSTHLSSRVLIVTMMLLSSASVLAGCSSTKSDCSMHAEESTCGGSTCSDKNQSGSTCCGAKESCAEAAEGESCECDKPDCDKCDTGKCGG